MVREEVLAYEARRRLHALVVEHPGVHLRELERLSGLPLSTLRYHMDYLERHLLVDAVEDRNVRRYFAREVRHPRDRAVMGALRQEALRNLILYLLAQGGEAPYRDLLAASRVGPSTLATHLAELTRRGLLARVPVGRESRYRLIHQEEVVRLLHTYRRSFLDALVDHLLDAVYQEGPPEDEGDEAR